MTQIDRSKLVLVFLDYQKNAIHCNVCKDYNGNIHGQCPCSSIKVADTCGNGNLSIRQKPPMFDNTKYIPIVIQGYPCRGKEYNLCSRGDCEACVVFKRKQVLEPE